MKFYRCKCGKCTSFGSEAPARCQECPECHTTLETHADNHKRAEPHKFVTEQVQTDEGLKPHTRCAWCGKTKQEAGK